MAFLTLSLVVTLPFGGLARLNSVLTPSTRASAFRPSAAWFSEFQAFVRAAFARYRPFGLAPHGFQAIFP